MRRLVAWLGPMRARLLVTLLVATGFGTLALQVAYPDEDWTFTAQLALVWVMFAVFAYLFGGRLPAKDRSRVWLTFGPGLLLVGLGVLIPNWSLFFAGGGLGWMVAAQMVLRGRMQMEYNTAIRHLRRSEFDQALEAMQPLIRAEPNDPNHRRFRAELYRLAGKPNQALADYRRVIELAPQSAMGYTGLAEVHAQKGQFDQARDYAVQAYEREPYQWMTAYNLGLVLDRLNEPAEATRYLEQALSNGVPHSRYRLLTHLWLARNYHRQGDDDMARAHIRSLRKQSRGLQEWDVVFGSEQAVLLRNMLKGDVQLAQQLVEADETDELVAIFDG